MQAEPCFPDNGTSLSLCPHGPATTTANTVTLRIKFDTHFLGSRPTHQRPLWFCSHRVVAVVRVSVSIRANLLSVQTQIHSQEVQRVEVSPL